MYLEDKWDNFFQYGTGSGRKAKPDQEEEGMQTLPSFRETGDNECEKTLSVIYDDHDLDRDHE